MMSAGAGSAATAGMSSGFQAALAGSAIKQGVNIAVGRQKSFSWASLAATTISQPISDSIGKSDFASAAGRSVTAVASGLARTVIQSTLTGGKLTFDQVAADAFGNVLGASLAQPRQESQEERLLQAREREIRATTQGTSLDNASLGASTSLLDPDALASTTRQVDRSAPTPWDQRYDPVAGNDDGVVLSSRQIEGFVDWQGFNEQIRTRRAENYLLYDNEPSAIEDELGNPPIAEGLKEIGNKLWNAGKGVAQGTITGVGEVIKGYGMVSSILTYGLPEKLGWVPDGTTDRSIESWHARDFSLFKYDQGAEIYGLYGEMFSPVSWLKAGSLLYRAGQALGDLGRLGSANAPEFTLVDPKRLVSRQAGDEMSSSKVRRLTQEMRATGYDASYPIEVVDVNGKLVIFDGHHRTEAAIKAGIRNVPVVVNDVPREQATQLWREVAEAAMKRDGFRRY